MQLGVLMMSAASNKLLLALMNLQRATTCQEEVDPSSPVPARDSLTCCSSSVLNYTLRQLHNLPRHMLAKLVVCGCLGCCALLLLLMPGGQLLLH
jgi:hypothetical protein